MNKTSKPSELICDECGSNYYNGTSEMADLCPECSYVLFGYPKCNHIFENGRCKLCGWNGSHSQYVTACLKRYNMTDQELRDELLETDKHFKNHPRFSEVETAVSLAVFEAIQVYALQCELRTPEYHDSDTELHLLVNSTVIIMVLIPFEEDVPVETYLPEPLSNYLTRQTQSNQRQITIALSLF